MDKKKIAFFASGSGSNIENIVTRFREQKYDIDYLILCNKPDAYVFQRAEKLGIQAKAFNRTQLRDSDEILDLLKNFAPDLVVLAGFLWLMPERIVKTFSGRIINIHPALLPKHGGKGMYGMLVHQAVVANKEPETGITIHHVNEHYDEGTYILQVKCKVNGNDTPEDVAQKVHALEYEHFPQVIERMLFEK